MTKITKQIPFGDHTLFLETGEIARQADAAIFASVGSTQVLVTVVGKQNQEGSKDFFPLTVNYQEKAFAAGKIPGGFNKREGRPNEHEVLVSRLIDRPLRPLFPENFFHEVQIVATVLSLDPKVPADVVAMIGASAALAISGIPFNGPIGAARVSYKDGVYLLNPSYQTLGDADLDLVIAGTSDAILMVESGAKELSEEVMLGAIFYGHEMLKGVIRAINDLAREVNKPKWDWTPPAANLELEMTVQNLAAQEISDAYLIKDKMQRYQKLALIKQKTLENTTEEGSSFNPEAVVKALDKLGKKIMRERILAGEPRIDGRDHVTVRPIAIRTKLLERAHGSALFTRGETQALVTTTLGNERDAQLLDYLTGESKDRFMLHYNFPPYSVGEVGMMGSPKRREIGHGRLAKRAILPVLPTAQEFPYVLRIVSEITESNGSSSMATVCGTSLALMDAAVPLKAPVAGVAMGLIKENDQFAVLTDILGDEDHLGDMDFKVAGTTKGVTALQMDIKIGGITQEILSQALEQALAGRMHILEIMKHALATPRQELSPHAPRITTMKVAEDKIRTIIGKGGSTIKSLSEGTGVSIDIDDTGVVQLFSPDAAALEEAQRQIKALIAEVEVGKTYHGKVSKIVDFGAFINLLPGKDGLLHISQICSDRSQKVESILAEGQEIDVFVAGIDKQGRVKLEWKKNEENVDVSPDPVVKENESKAIVAPVDKIAADDIESESISAESNEDTQ